MEITLKYDHYFKYRDIFSENILAELPKPIHSTGNKGNGMKIETILMLVILHNSVVSCWILIKYLRFTA